MAVIPLTLTISLCLVFTFVIFFLREQARPRFGSAESEALLPLADELRRPVERSRPPPRGARPLNPTRQKMRTPAASPAAPGADHVCGCKSGKHAPCAGCRDAHPKH